MPGKEQPLLSSLINVDQGCLDGLQGRKGELGVSRELRRVTIFKILEAKVVPEFSSPSTNGFRAVSGPV